MNPVGILLVGHGSPRAEANASFTSLAERVAARLDGAMVRPAFFSLARPNIRDQVSHLATVGIRRVVLMPYFLYSGQHVRSDIPAQLSECRASFPQMEFEVLPTLQDEPLLEDLVVERLTPFVATGASTPSDPRAIERQSMAIIERRLGRGLDPASQAIVRRVVHATADFSFAQTMRIHPEAVERGVEALRAGKPIICDVRMLRAGITKVGVDVLCAMGDPVVAEHARTTGSTRAAAAMELLIPHLSGAIVAIGNAPTALFKVLEIAAKGGPRPALVVGLPVGFVGARESKQALLESDLCYVTNVGPRGGSPAAAAAVNALALLEKERSPSCPSGPQER